MERVVLGDVCDVIEGTLDSQKYVKEGIPLIASKKVVDKGHDLAIKNVALIKIKKESKVLERYVKYLLESNRFKRYAEKEKRGGTRRFLSLGSIRSFTFPLVSAKEQEKTVEMLDDVSFCIAKRKEQIEECDRLMKSRFVEMFGEPNSNSSRWKVLKFGQVTRNFDSYRYSVKRADRENMHGEYPYYGATGIVDYVNDYKLEGTYLLVSADGKNLECKNKDIAFVVSGKIWASNQVHVLQTNELINMKYLIHYINNFDISNFVTGREQKKLYRSNMDLIPVSLPPIELQNQFADFVYQVEQLKLEIQLSLEELQTLYDCLMQKCFS